MRTVETTENSLDVSRLGLDAGIYEVQVRRKTKAYVNGTHACKTHFPGVDYDCFLSTQIRAVTAIGVGNYSTPITITVNDSEADSEGMRHFASNKFTFHKQNLPSSGLPAL